MRNFQGVIFTWIWIYEEIFKSALVYRVSVPLKQAMTSAYSKSSNSSGFNPILQKFCMMICEIIGYKTVYHRHLNISRLIYLEKNSAYCFEFHNCTNKMEEFFFENKIFQGLGALFTTAKPLICASFFSTKKWFYTIFQVWLFNFNAILKTCFKNLFRKTVKNWWFYSFKQASRTLQATFS